MDLGRRGQGRARVRAVYAVIVVLAVFASPLRAETITIGYNSEWPPFSSGNGATVDGILVRLVSRIVAEATGDEVRNIGLPWTRVQHEVEEGRIDAMVTFASPERLSYAERSENVVFTLETKAFARRGSEAEAAIRKNPSMETHRRFVHCAMIGDDYTQSMLTENDIPFQTGLNNDGCIRQVVAGRQEAYLHFWDAGRTSMRALGVENELAVLPKVYRSVPFHFLLSKKSSVSPAFIEKFDAALDRMVEDGRYEALLHELRSSSDTVRVATLEWPPYTGADLPGNGAITEIVRMAFQAAGLVSDDLILPWKRAIAYAKSGQDGVVAYYPGYHCHHDKGFTASNRIGEGPLNFAERIDRDIRWDTLHDLEALHIGTVVGYANTESFDQWVKDGRLTTITSINDTENLKKLADGKIDLAVVDGFVFKHLVRTQPELAAVRDSIRLDDHALDVKNLFLCFRDDDEGRHLRDLFNEGLKSVDRTAVWRQSLQGQ